jgi:hypothetical protein
VQQRSLERVAALRAIEPAAEGGAGPHPLLTLRIGIAFHEAIVQVCEDFE